MQQHMPHVCNPHVYLMCGRARGSQCLHAAPYCVTSKRVCLLSLTVPSQVADGLRKKEKTLDEDSFIMYILVRACVCMCVFLHV